MKKINVFEKDNLDLEVYNDNRGTIADVFYNHAINHVAIITSEPNVIRGNHYHKETTQHMLMTKGSLEYWYKDFGSDEPAKMYVAKVGDLVSTKPYEIHGLRICSEGNEFIVFSEGLRGGKDYESDTYRVESIIG
jgi:dTDP-4-dehydrorhamnose 3,5-epimerase-like enzyme